MKSSEPESILVYSPSWIGDAVMALGALRAVKARFPESHLTVLAKPWVEELYHGCEAVDATLRYDARGVHRGPLGFLRLARTLRNSRFDRVVLFPNAFRAAAVVWAAGIPQRWGYGTDGRSLLLSRSVPPAPRPFGRHQSYYYLDMLRGLGIATDVPQCHLTLTEAMKNRAREILSVNGWHGEHALVGLHPGATNSAAKRWLPERFAELSERLASDQNARVVLLGGPKEVSLAEEIGSRMQTPPIFLAGATSLPELMGILDSLSVFVTNDSGPMHLAAALGVSTVAVFGPTDERETGPMGRTTRVVRKQVECSPCLLKECPTDHLCMVSVDVQDVFAAAVDLMESRRAPRAAEAASR